MVAAVVNARGMNVARSVLITLEAYLVFFSASFFSSSLSTGIDKFDGALAFSMGYSNVHKGLFIFSI